MATLLALASLVTLAVSQSCPSGYAPYQGSSAPNQTVRWVSCPYSDPTNNLYEPTLQCGTIQVPVDYTNTNSKMMTLALVKIPANSSSSSRKSIVYNPGGPGVSGISSLVGYGPTYVQLAGGQYDIITFDPRGTGLTNPYACPMPATQPAALGLPLSDPRGLNATYVYNLAQGDVCNRTAYREAGELVGTAFVARDVDAIFQALNEDGKIRYWGFSYGTLLGSTIAAMFPNKIDRMVLDGNINPTDYYHGTNEESVDDVDAAVSYFFQTCATAGSTYCDLAVRGATGAQLEAAFRGYLTGLLNGTYTTTIQGEVWSYGDVKGYLFSQLKSPRRWATVASNIAAFYQGTKGPRSMKRQTSGSTAPFNIANSFNAKTSNALEAITCGDWDDINASLQDYSRYLQLYNQRSYYGGDQLISILLSCSTWDVNAREQYNGEFTNINTSTPILFVNGPYDPVTPLSSAKNSSSGFKNSVVLQTLGAGHCSTAHPSTCVRTKVASYFSSGRLPDVSQPCQPDNAPFSGALISSSSNYTDVPGGTTNRTRAGEEFQLTDEFRQAIKDAETAIEPKVGFVYHSALLDLVKREEARTIVEGRSLVARQSANSASCTPTTRAQPSGSSSGSSGSSSGNKNAAGQIAIVSGLTFLGVAAGFILALF